MTLFAANNGFGGFELWRTDGTGVRTALVKEIRAGALGGSPSNSPTLSGGPLPFAVLNGFAYFAADDGVGGMELWRSDGTPGGTVQVTNLAGATGYSPTNIVVANNQLFFLASGPGGFGIYKSNGTDAGTSLVSSTVIGLTGFIASAGQGRIYWSIDDGLSTSGLYTSDGIGPVAKLVNGGNSTGIYDAVSAIYYVTTGGLTKVVGAVATAVTGEPTSISTLFHVGNTVYFTEIGSQTLWSTRPSTH